MDDLKQKADQMNEFIKLLKTMKKQSISVKTSSQNHQQTEQNLSTTLQKFIEIEKTENALKPAVEKLKNLLDSFTEFWKQNIDEQVIVNLKDFADESLKKNIKAALEAKKKAESARKIYISAVNRFNSLAKKEKLEPNKFIASLKNVRETRNSFEHLRNAAQFAFRSIDMLREAQTLLQFCNYMENFSELYQKGYEQMYSVEQYIAQLQDYANQQNQNLQQTVDRRKEQWANAAIEDLELN
eukprot:Anaeramoba_ignava/a92552_35.p1 GENE.a92552_35~~a92552_35.p1  ORF type:complete len:280 (+),score=120.25 a92552_35:118-840(+)